MALSKSLFQDSVRERDLDNFLIEEISASADFRNWIIEYMKVWFDPPADSELRVHKSPQRLQDNRQTDVQIGWFSPDGDMRGCVLIESKVTADFQIGQADDYLAEANAHRRKLGERAVATLLVAPHQRLQTLSQKNIFDAEISIEAIISTLEARLVGDLSDEIIARLIVRIDLLEALCGRRRAPQWSPITIQSKRDFATAYDLLAAEIIPSLKVRPTVAGKKATTRIFDGLDLAAYLPNIRIRHEFGSNVSMAYANIQFPGRAESIHDFQKSGLVTNTPYKLNRAGLSLSVRVDTPGVNAELPFQLEEFKVRTGLESLHKLIEWTSENHSKIAD